MIRFALLSQNSAKEVPHALTQLSSVSASCLIHCALCIHPPGVCAAVYRGSHHCLSPSSSVPLNRKGHSSQLFVYRKAESPMNSGLPSVLL